MAAICVGRHFWSGAPIGSGSHGSSMHLLLDTFGHSFGRTEFLPASSALESL